MPRPPEHSRRRLTSFELKQIRNIILAKMEVAGRNGKYFDRSDLRYFTKEAEQYVIQGGKTLHSAVELAMNSP
tara:strand:+ start:106 stop:324 length:219 start_codon:yes stop_codon:yes gene_type:complete